MTKGKVGGSSILVEKAAPSGEGEIVKDEVYSSFMH